MSAIDSTQLRNQVMYSIYVRQYGAQGKFADVQADLDRIKSLGVDVIWLLPIHPIGESARKGALGSPYAIRDYRKINPEFGTLEDFTRLVDAIHARGMKCIIDVVYNHTSPDSWLAQNHPEWFYHKPDGSFGNRIGDWSDIIDLDYAQRGLWDYQIETLKYWASIVDGFRCDVAPLIPLEFWLREREEVNALHPDCLWLSESVEAVFTLDNRERDMTSLSDSEIHQAFDLSYEYDVYHDWVRLLCGECTLQEYSDALNQQESIYPAHYAKLRFIENHDRPRAAFLIPDALARKNWTAFLYFRKGMTLLYNGQERESLMRPNLFDADPIDWNTGADISDFLRALYRLKQHPLMAEGRFFAQDMGNGMLMATYRKGDRRLIGAFSTQGKAAPIRVSLEDGLYTNLIDGTPIPVQSGMLRMDGQPLAIEVNK